MLRQLLRHNETWLAILIVVLCAGVTIATFNIYFGMLYVITHGKLINLVHPMFRDFGNTLLFSRVSSIGASYGLSLMTLVWLAAVLLGWFILRKTFLGRSVFAIGGNEVAAERLG